MSNHDAQKAELVRQLQEIEAQEQAEQHAKEHAGKQGFILSQQCLTTNHTACMGEEENLPCICFCHVTSARLEAEKAEKEAAGGKGT